MRADQLDTGTSANQVVKLDGSSRLPAVDGSLLTGISGGGGGGVGSPAIDVIVDQYNNIVGASGAGDSVSVTAVDNVFLGRNSGNAIDGGKENIFIGLSTGESSVDGSYNVLVGKHAGINLGTTFYNIGIGPLSLGISSAGVTGDSNIAIGLSSLRDITSGAYNTVFGHTAGNNITTGEYNVCVGYNAGPTTNQSNQLYIDIAESDTPLIHGNFSTNIVTIHGDLTGTGNVVGHIAINAQIGVAYKLVLADDGLLVTMDNASANTLSVPTNAQVAFPIGTQILVEQEGAGTTSIASVGIGSPAAGSPALAPVTLHSAGGLVDTATQFSTVTLIKKAADTWLLTGDLA